MGASAGVVSVTEWIRLHVSFPVYLTSAIVVDSLAVDSLPQKLLLSGLLLAIGPSLS